MVIAYSLFYLGTTLYTYTDVHTFGWLDRNKCLYCMDYERCTFYHALCESGWDVKKAIKLIKGELIPVA